LPAVPVAISPSACYWAAPLTTFTRIPSSSSTSYDSVAHRKQKCAPRCVRLPLAPAARRFESQEIRPRPALTTPKATSECCPAIASKPTSGDKGTRADAAAYQTNIGHLGLHRRSWQPSPAAGCPPLLGPLHRRLVKQQYESKELPQFRGEYRLRANKVPPAAGLLQCRRPWSCRRAVNDAGDRQQQVAAGKPFTAPSA
jgi:hypothetical protein